MGYIERGIHDIFNTQKRAEMYSVGYLDYKIFKYVHRMKAISFNDLCKKFIKMSLINDRINNLSNRGYLELTKVEGKEKQGNLYVLTPQAENYYFEIKDKKSTQKWTLIISGFSLLISVTAIVVSLLNASEL